MQITHLKKINDFEWEIPKSYRDDMRVSVRIFATHELITQVLNDKSLDQAVNAATLPGLAGEVVVMPDMHQGYGFPIGGVAATEFPQGVVSPGAIGYDINCGVRLLASRVEYDSVREKLDSLASLLNKYCPTGVGSQGVVRANLPELDMILREGARWALKNGYALVNDLQRTEEGGCLEDADPAMVSNRAKMRGKEQIGSLGAGNHFIEVDVVEKVFDGAAATAMGLHQGCLTVQIHCGSRGLGHQICTDYVQEFQGAVHRYGIDLPDRELVCAPMDSPEGRAYLGAMRAAANFAFANRQLLAHSARRAFEETFAGKGSGWELVQVYDIAHNMGKIETHSLHGRLVKVCIHRKGATRAFGPGSPELPWEYRSIGQPVLVPGSMGTASYVLTGTEESMIKSWGSSCHGAGRLMSRHQAKREIRGEQLRNDLEGRGIKVRAGSLPGLAEESPHAYKDVDAVVDTVVSAGIAKKVARLIPVAVIKG
jgi:tRNA-splicing ligase RtcB